MPQTPSPREIVNRQRVVYNAHDIEGYGALFAAELHIMAIYEVREGLIRSLRFIRRVD